MKWEALPSTGVPLLDHQHQALVDCVNELETAGASGRLLLTVYAMDRLRDYVHSHFAAEEDLMRMHGFPGLEAHIAEHRAFTAKLFELMNANVRKNNTVELVAFLNQWLSQHVGGTDMAYVPYLAAAAPAVAQD